MLSRISIQPGGNLRIKRFIPLLALPALLAAGTLGIVSSNAFAGGSLTGAGSTLVAPFVENVFAPDFQSQVRHERDLRLSRLRSRHHGHQQQDRRLRRVGRAAHQRAGPGVHRLRRDPVGAGAQPGLSYNLSGISHLNLTGPVIAEIYLGQITSWNDPAIAALNKGETLPNEKITPVWRSDGSGDTYAFTSYLSKVSPTWASKVGAATSVSFPVGTGGKGNSGVAAVVSSTPGAIGNNSWFYIRQAGLKAVAIANGAGKYEYPYEPNLVAAADLLKKVPSLNTLSATTATTIATDLSIVDPPVQQAEEGREALADPEGRGGGLPDRDFHLRDRAPRRRQHLDAEAVHQLRVDPGRAEEGHRWGAPVRAAAVGGRRRGHQGSERAVASWLDVSTG